MVNMYAHPEPGDSTSQGLCQHAYEEQVVWCTALQALAADNAELAVAAADPVLNEHAGVAASALSATRHAHSGPSKFSA